MLRVAALGLLVSLAAPSSARAQAAKETTLLQDDLAANRRTKIDAPKDDLDSQLDAALGGPQGFSTRELERIEDTLRAELRRDRPRASPRLILFLYPGRVSAEKLKSMSEVNVDMELVMDPCERSVCRDAVGKHIELVGRAVGQPVLSKPGYKLIFKTVTLKTSTAMHDQEVMVYQIPIADCITAAARPGGGVAWLAAQEHADDAYEPIVIKAIARRAAERRVALVGPPSVTRAPTEVDVTLKVRGDRARVQQQVIDAMAAAAAGLRDNPKTPSQTRLDVTLEITMHGAEPRRFRSQGSPVALYVDGKLDGAALWSSYVQELKKEKGAQTLAFDDADTRAGAGEEAAPDDNQALAVLSAGFAPLGACAQREAARSPGFHGVTLSLRWQPSGAAELAAPKSGPLAQCLQSALTAIHLPRFNGAARAIDYPIRVK